MNGIEDYCFKSKNNWRQRVWRQFAKRYRNGGGPILYMPGPNDLDRAAAIRYGIRHRDLIGVEQNKERCKALRKMGRNVIHGDILEVLANWKTEPSIGGVFLDFCGGLFEKDFDKNIYAIKVANTIRFAPVVLNFMRGRDDINRGVYIQRAKHANLPKYRLNDIPLKAHSKIDHSKHRGSIWFTWYVISSFMFELGEHLVTSQDDGEGRGERYNLDASIDNFFQSMGKHGHKRYGEWRGALKPILWSYKTQSNIYMDSVIFSHSNIHTRFSPSRNIQNTMGEIILDIPEENRTAIRRIAAAKAVRSNTRVGHFRRVSPMVNRSARAKKSA